MCKHQNGRVEENGEQIMKKKLQKLHIQRKIWKKYYFGHFIV
jgi:hypothetical protein